MTLLRFLGSLLDPNTEDSVSEADNAGSSTAPSVPLTSINAVAAHLSYIDSARARVTADMESMVINGLATLVSDLILLPQVRRLM